MSNIDALHIEGLRYQLSEHFIFNVMNTMRVLIRKDTHQATTMLNTFSEYLRYALHKTHEFYTTIEKETEGIDLFLQLQEIRFKKKIILVKNISPDALYVSIPAFVLQPFAEQVFKKSTPEHDGITRLYLNILRKSNMLHITLLAGADEQAPALTEVYFSPKSDAELGCEQALALCTHLYSKAFEYHAKWHNNQYSQHLQIPT